MTPRDMLGDINTMINVLAGSNTGGCRLHLPHIRQLPGRQELVTWTGPRDINLGSLSFGTLNEYFAILRHRHFNVILEEGSILQMEYGFVHGMLVKHRLSSLSVPGDLRGGP